MPPGTGPLRRVRAMRLRGGGRFLMMARAGFTAIHSGRITFGKDGRWYCDGEPIRNRAICRLYAKAMTIGDDGVARLQVGEDKAQVGIEDTPWVVVQVEGDPGRGFHVLLNDETLESLDPDSLRVGAGNVLYCSVKQGRYEARFLRQAYYELMRHAEPGPDDRPCLRVGGRRVLIG